MESDKERVQQILSGDMNAFRLLIDDFQRLVCHIVFRMVANETDREEICQEVFIKVHQNLSAFHFKSKLSTWIGRIAYHTAINYLKKKKLPLYDDFLKKDFQNGKLTFETPSSVDGFATTLQMPDDDVINQETMHFIYDEIEQLPPDFRAILTMFHLDEMKYAEIGEVMNLPEGTVKSYLFRARKLLKERLLEKYSLETFE